MDEDLMRSLPEKSIAALRGALRRTGGVKTRGGRLPPISARAMGLSSNKKTFAPSIPQRRNQSKETQEENQKKPSNERERGFKQGRGRGRGRKEYIQTTGALFGEGVAHVALKRPGPESSYTKADLTPSMPVYKPTELKTKKELEDEERMFKEENEDFSEDEFEDDEKLVYLPLSQCSLKTEVKDEKKPILKADEEALCKLYGDIKIKKEVTADFDEDVKPTLDEFGNVKDEKPVKSFEENSLFLLQFPSRMPFQNPKTEGNKKDSAPQRETTATDDEDENEKIDEPGVSFSEMQSGLMGTLQFLKSGKMKLLLGSVQYIIQPTEDISFLQEVVTVDEEKEEMTVLGTVKKKFTCFPNIDEFLALAC